MHGPEIHQGEPGRPDQLPERDPSGPEPEGAIWLVSGIGEGPRLAAELLARGWRLKVSVVSESAAQAYAPHPYLELQVGALDGIAAIAAALEAERFRGGFRWVVDGTHPFAEQISADLLAACQRLDQPLLRLQRPLLPLFGADPGASPEASPASGFKAGSGSSLVSRPRQSPSQCKSPSPSPSRAPCPGPKRQLLANLEELAGLELGGRRLLLAIGARQLGQALARSPGATHFARILPTPSSLALARAAGLADGQLACLHPRPLGAVSGLGLLPPGVDPVLPGPPSAGAIERALCRRWAIDAVLCRQSGGLTEQLWSDLCAELGLELLLLRQPRARDPAPGLELGELLAALGHPDDASLASLGQAQQNPD